MAVGGIVPLGHLPRSSLTCHPGGNDHQALSLPTASRRGVEGLITGQTANFVEVQINVHPTLSHVCAFCEGFLPFY